MMDFCFILLLVGCSALMPPRRLSFGQPWWSLLSIFCVVSFVATSKSYCLALRRESYIVCFPFCHQRGHCCFVLWVMADPLLYSSFVASPQEIELPYSCSNLHQSVCGVRTRINSLFVLPRLRLNGASIIIGFLLFVGTTVMLVAWRPYCMEPFQCVVSIVLNSFVLYFCIQRQLGLIN